MPCANRSKQAISREQPGGNANGAGAQFCAGARTVRSLAPCRCRRTSLLDAHFGGSLHLLECPNLDLPNPLPRHLEFLCKVFQCPGLFDEMPRLEDPALSMVENADRADQRFGPLLGFLLRDVVGLVG